MSLNPQTQPCDADRLEQLILGNLPEVEEQQLNQHLASCGSCRKTLEQLAADSRTWQEVDQLLQPQEFNAPSKVGDFTSLLLGETRDTVPSKSPQIRTVLDSLAPTDDPAKLGRIGAYEVSGVIGSGGMGVVLKAVDLSLDRTVAIKVMAPHLATSGAARKRFERESKAAAAVLHPNVVAIHSVSTSQSLPFLVMPYVRGTSLQQRLIDQGPLAVTEVLRIGSQTAAGLAAAHAQGLVHRDIKPANLLLEEGVERVAISDFGLARAVDDATLTRSGVIAGTPQYMSPEQARGESVDGRSDLFSLGSVMYAMCTGRPPFREETTFGVIRRITEDQPTPIRELNPEIPDWLSLIVEQLMSKDRNERFESAAEVHELLEQCTAHVQQPEAVALPTELHRSSDKKAQAENEASQSGRRRKSFSLFAILLAGVLGLFGFLGWQLTDNTPDISGKWSDQDWGQVELTQQSDGISYSGTFSQTVGDGPGTLSLKWSRTERRFNGTWIDGGDRDGDLSLQLVDEEIRGAWTTSKTSKINPATPALADLLWTRQNESLRRAETTRHKSNDFLQPLAVLHSPSQAKELPDIRVTGKDVTIKLIEEMADQKWGTVTFADTKFTGAMIERLRHIPSIRTLRLFGERLSGQIGLLRNVNGLVALDLETPLQERDLVSLGKLTQLERLSLPRDHALTVTGARQIAKLSNLKSLTLNNVEVDDASFGELKTLVKLEELDLTRTRITDEGLKTIENMPNLRTLNLTRYGFIDEKLTDQCIPSLLRLEKLESLSISGKITNDGLRLIAKAPKLKSLSIQFTDIYGDGLAGLEDSTVESLTISPRQAGSSPLWKGVYDLKKCKSIKHVTVSGQPIGNEAELMYIHPDICWGFNSN